MKMKSLLLPGSLGTFSFTAGRRANALGLIAAAGLFGAGAASAVNITTQHGDNGRTGLNASETTLTTSNVNQASFGKLFEKCVDGDMYPQPLYLQDVSIGGGTHNVVYCLDGQ